MNNRPAPTGKSSALALGLAFLPSVIAISTLALAGNDPPGWLLAAVSGVGLLCCFFSAYVLLRSNSGWMLLFGFLFSAVNVAISLFFGCGACVSSTSFH